MSKKTLINFILDKSGSMDSVLDATISGFNEYLATLKKDKKVEYEFSFTLFDTIVEQRNVESKLKLIKKLDRESFVPSGMTALYDAVCKTIKDVDYDGKVITVILTDGGENSSREYNMETMRSLIKEKEKTGKWTFVYMGANQDSYAVAQNYGFATGNITNFKATTRGMGAAFTTMAMNTSSLANSEGDITLDFFSVEDQSKLENNG